MKTARRHMMTLALAATIAFALAPAPGSAGRLGPSSATHTAHRSSSAQHAELLSFLMQPVADPAQFEGKRIAILASDGASAFELETARDYLMDRGARVHVLAPRPVERARMVGLAGFVPPSELLTILDYAGGRRLVGVTWYLDQVAAQDYDAVYVPNNLVEIERLGTNDQTIRFLVTAQSARRPIFVTGNATAVIPGRDIPRAIPLESAVAMQAPHWQVYAGEGAFDMPQLIGALADTLADAPKREIN